MRATDPFNSGEFGGGGDLSPPIPAPPLRDWAVLEAVRAALAETGAFDDVALPELPEGRGISTGERLAVVTPGDWEEVDEAQDPDGVQDTVRLRFGLTLIVREGDPLARDDAVDRLLATAKDAIDGAELVPGRTIPGWTKLRRGRWERAEAPERRMTVVGESAYWIDGDDQHDTGD